MPEHVTKLLKKKNIPFKVRNEDFGEYPFIKYIFHVKIQYYAG